MLVPYIPEESADFYDEYYSAQVGGGMSIPVYRGKPIMNGNGIGSIFSGLMRSALPMLKKGVLSAGGRLLKSGANVLSDVASGENIAQSAKSRFSSAGRDILGDAKSEILGQFTSGGRGRKRKAGGGSRAGVKKRRKKTSSASPRSILD